MFALAYASYCTVDSTELDLDALASHASAKNSSLGISGYLCYDHGVFFQYMEGERQAVLDLMEVIEKDARHDVINKVTLGEYDDRIFPDWSMRYLNRSDLRRVDLEHVLEHSLFHMDPKLYGQDNIVALIKAIVQNIAARQSHLKVG
ncbi:BLUF domain-containing protein [Bremerella sp. T1]|uniref:BLUF domain-containing protein n=1 Tax=Bremerella sp. TYQ1 TaxID=3119568 RepID=UPI001CCA6FE4|nr:BLUF domain-containing protein [Bremerella volcania]UBM35673.1 BLUF domain-containing protein [Bremerella volcania]